jgi:hypothetical protein
MTPLKRLPVPVPAFKKGISAMDFAATPRSPNRKPRISVVKDEEKFSIPHLESDGLDVLSTERCAAFGEKLADNSGFVGVMRVAVDAMRDEEAQTHLASSKNAFRERRESAEEVVMQSVEAAAAAERNQMSEIHAHKEKYAERVEHVPLDVVPGVIIILHITPFYYIKAE